jgi:hypothetical protein
MPTATEVLGDFFQGLSGQYLVLGDPRHGATSAETIVKYVRRSGKWGTPAFGRVSTYFVLMEGYYEGGKILPVVEDVAKDLRSLGFVVVPAENSTVAPENPTTEWVDNERVPVSNSHWVDLAGRLAGTGDLVVICCGTSHVGRSWRIAGGKQEAGLMARLGGAPGYAVVSDGSHYTPEKDSLTWKYDPLTVMKPR